MTQIPSQRAPAVRKPTAPHTGAAELRSPFDTTGPSSIGAGLALATRQSATQSQWVQRETARRGRSPGTIEGLARVPESQRHLPDFGKGRAG